jgi:hypothetical protein
MGWDLILNLASEIIGIALTVFLVDRLIQKREEARWKPSKYLFYSDLLHLLSKFIDTCLYRNLKTSSYVYLFDTVSAYSTDFDLKGSFFEMLKSGFWNGLVTDTNKLSGKRRFEKLNRIIEVGNEINELVARYMPLIEPELLTKLMELHNSLDRIREISKRPKPERSHISSDADKKRASNLFFAKQYYEIAFAAQQPKAWIEAQASKRLRSDEYWSVLEQGTLVK